MARASLARSRFPGLPVADDSSCCSDSNLSSRSCSESSGAPYGDKCYALLPATRDLIAGRFSVLEELPVHSNRLPPRDADVDALADQISALRLKSPPKPPARKRDKLDLRHHAADKALGPVETPFADFGPGHPDWLLNLRGRRARPQLRSETFDALEPSTQEPQLSSQALATAGCPVWDNSPVASIEPPGDSLRSPSPEPQREHCLVVASRNLPPSAQQLRKAKARQFELLVGVPVNEAYVARRLRRSSLDPSRAASATERKVYFGANLLGSSSRSGTLGAETKGDPVDFQLISSPLTRDKFALLSLEQQISAITWAELMAEIGTPSCDADTDSPSMPRITPMRRNGCEAMSEDSSEPDSHASSAADPGSAARLLTTRASNPALRLKDSPPCHSSPAVHRVSRIEDSIEAIDELEDSLEAFELVTVPERIVSPDDGGSEASPKKSQGSSARKPTSLSKVKTMSLRVGAPASPGGGRSIAAVMDRSPELASASLRRKNVSRPASLLPPKPPARSAKQPTKPTFELPGDAVARRLKEQREARLVQQQSVETLQPKKTAGSLRRTPTVPRFELPGEAISRRKREEREARLRAQEEEERKRRTFKAKPVRSSMAGPTANYPRETLTGRVRLGKSGAGASVDDANSPVIAKRMSAPMLGSTGSFSRDAAAAASNTMSAPSFATAQRRPAAAAATIAVPQSRGRAPATSLSSSSSSQQHHSPKLQNNTSRAASSSTGGIANGPSGSAKKVPGKRASASVLNSGAAAPTLSAEVAQLQRLRGKEIFRRDNRLQEAKERERLEREELARRARFEAAERSGMLSREWAEKKLHKTASLRRIKSKIGHADAVMQIDGLGVEAAQG